MNYTLKQLVDNDFNQLPESPGIYSILNSYHRRKYYGKAMNIKERLRRHYNELSKNQHHNDLLQTDFHYFNLDIFKINIEREIESNSGDITRQLTNEERNFILKDVNEGLYNFGHIKPLLNRNIFSCSLCEKIFDNEENVYIFTQINAKSANQLIFNLLSLSRMLFICNDHESYYKELLKTYHPFETLTHLNYTNKEKKTQNLSLQIRNDENNNFEEFNVGEIHFLKD